MNHNLFCQDKGEQRDMIQDRIKKIRKHFGLSQAQFSKAIGKTAVFISLAENGKSGVAPGTVRTICSVFAYVAGIEHLGRKQLNSVVAKIEQCRRQNCTLTE
jgi:transcriptional regulator with XRE-family HTH domain